MGLKKLIRSGVALCLAAVLAGEYTVAVAPLSAVAQRSEYLIKAGYLYHFAKFVDWPDTAFGTEDAPLLLCVAGEDPFGVDLKSVTQKTVKGRELRTRLLGGSDEFDGCHILFVSQSEERHFSAILDEVGNHHVLTVGDAPDFANRGGIITLFTDEKKVRFRISTEAATKANLKMSSELLKLAELVDAKERPSR